MKSRPETSAAANQPPASGQKGEQKREGKEEES